MPPRTASRRPWWRFLDLAGGYSGQGLAGAQGDLYAISERYRAKGTPDAQIGRAGAASLRGSTRNTTCTARPMVRRFAPNRRKSRLLLSREASRIQRQKPRSLRHLYLAAMRVSLGIAGRLHGAARPALPMSTGRSGPHTKTDGRRLYEVVRPVAPMNLAPAVVEAQTGSAAGGSGTVREWSSTRRAPRELEAQGPPLALHTLARSSERASPTVQGVVERPCDRPAPSFRSPTEDHRDSGPTRCSSPELRDGPALPKLPTSPSFRCIPSQGVRYCQAPRLDQ
jgi:hypothetical protein